MAMSARRDRPPSGRHNARENKEFYQQDLSGKSSSRPQSARVRNPSPRQNENLETRRMNRPVSASQSPTNTHGVGFKSNHFSSSSDRFPQCLDSPHIDSAGSIVQKLRDKIEIEKRAAESEKTRLLGKFNAFSRPKPSVKYPLRSSLLDPEVNNFPPSKTRTELMRKLRVSAIPHPSYDIDGDGWVSQEDYKLAKRFDFDGNGVIDPDEREVAKHVIADEFFRKNADNIRVFGKQFANRTHEENIESLEKAYCFERTLSQLKSVEDGLRSRSSKQMTQCMANESTEMARSHFYNDKFDTVAFTDFDAVPRSQLTMNWTSSSPTLELKTSIQSSPAYGNMITEHHGSRRLLLMARKEQAKLQASIRFESATAGQPKYRAQKLALISDFKLEN